MQKEDIDKITRSIDDGLTVFADVKSAIESGDKLTLLEGGLLAVKHSGKAIRFIGSIHELGAEIADLDSMEAKEITDKLASYFGGSDAVRDAIGKISIGAGSLNQGIQELIALKKTVVD